MASGIGEVGSGRNGILRVVTNSELIAMEREAEQKLKQQEATPILSKLAKRIDDAWTRNRTYKETSNVEEEMLQNMRQRECEYDSAKLAQIQAMNGPEIFMGLTGVKCRAAEAWIFDVLGSTNARSWKLDLDPTPLPSLDPTLQANITERTMMEWQRRMLTNTEEGPMTPQQAYDYASQLREAVEKDIRDEAAKRSERMEIKINDQMVEGNWSAAFDEFISDLVTFKKAVIKGPIVKQRRKLQWSKTADGKRKPRVKEVDGLHFERVSPFDIFPSPSATTVQDGDFIERMKLRRSSLRELKDIDGYDNAAIDAVLTNFDSGALRLWTYADTDRAELEKKGFRDEQEPDLITGLEFWGSVTGQELVEDGVAKDFAGKPINPTKDYEINAIKIGPYLIYKTTNPDPLGRRPYLCSEFESITGAFWGKGVPELMKDLQTVCNSAARSLVYNMSIASGPQVGILDYNRLLPGQDVTRQHPWKAWLFTNKANSTAQPLYFYNPESHAAEILQVYNEFAKMADLFTGIPAYTHGNEQIAGAGRTYGGLSMLMTAAARGIKKVIARISTDVIQEAVSRLYDWNMVYDPDESIKGDVAIVPVGPLAEIMREQMSAQRLTFLQATANPIDQPLIGLKGRAAIWREEAKSLEIPVDEVVATKEKVAKLEEQQETAQEIQNVVALQQAQKEVSGIGEPGGR